MYVIPEVYVRTIMCAFLMRRLELTLDASVDSGDKCFKCVDMQHAIQLAYQHGTYVLANGSIRMVHD